MQKCRIQLLDSLQFVRGNQVHTRFRTHKTACLLAYLAVHPGLHPREVLADLIWPDDAPEAGRHSLRMALSSLRRQLESSDSQQGVEEIFESNRFAVGLRSAAFSTDVGDFDAAIRQAHHSPSEALRARWNSQAVSLYKGSFLPGFYDDWCLDEATRLQGAFEDALAFLVGWHKARGEDELSRDYERRAASLGVSPPMASPPQQIKPTAPPIVRAENLEVASAPQTQSQQPLLTAKAPVSALVTLLAFDGLLLTSELQEVLAAHGGHQIAFPTEDTAILWAFSGATGAFHGATALGYTDTKTASLRIALCTGETHFALSQWPGLEEGAIGPHARVLGLLESAHQGQTLCCESTTLLLRGRPEVEIWDLGTFHVQGAGSGVAPERVFQIQWCDQVPREFAPLRALKARNSFIPQPLGRFFGRESEMAMLLELLDHERLITLSGVGGAGKTRLSLQLALRVESSSEKAAIWVSLADVPDASGVADAVLDVLGVKRHNALSAFDSLVQELNRSFNSSVLLLDNFEHLVEEGARVIERLLEKVPTLQCLTTSRRVLGARGEVEVPLAPLSIPPSSSAPETPQSLEDQPCVRLFCDRARLVRPDFVLTAHNAPTIAQLCRHLEGMPLALELAAARVGSLSPARILERLQAHQSTEPDGIPAFERFDFLHTASRTAPTRHRTLRAALDWSFEALEPELQAFFSRLWVFRGGCSVEAASEIGGNPNALHALEELRHRSLLFVQRDAEEPRFRMLETMRQYTLERAYERGEVESTRRSHARYFLKWAQEEAPHAVGPDASARLQSWNRVREEADNLRLALAWATEHDPETAIRLAMACHDFSGVHLSEREMNIERALQGVQAQNPSDPQKVSPFLLAGALGMAATHASNRGDVAKQTEFAKRRLELMREASDPEDVAWALFDWGCARRNSGHFAQARTALEQARAIFEKVGGSRRFQLLGWALTELGICALHAGDLETAMRDFQGCEEAFTLSGDFDGQASAKALLANVLFHQDETLRARELWRDVNRIERELGDEREHPWRRHQEGKLAVAMGDLERGHDLLRRALRAFWMEGHKRACVHSLLGLSGFWLAANRPERALLLLRVETAERTQAGWPCHQGWEPLRQSFYEQACSLVAFSAHRSDSEEELPDLASIVQEELRGFE